MRTGARAAFAADAVAGKSVFKSQCSVCHSIVVGAKGGIGPTLYGVIDRKAGSLPGYNYSGAMKALGYIWSEAKLKAYLPAPQQAVRGTKMTFGGIKDSKKVDDVVAYLATLK